MFIKSSPQNRTILYSMESGVWPVGKTSAIIFSIDDIHPGRSVDAYEAGGDLEKGVLGRLVSLLLSHAELKATLFITPDWREVCPFPTRLVGRIPVMHQWFYLTSILPEGTMAIDRHQYFSEFLRELPRCEYALHGLHHVHRGRRVPVEYQSQSERSCIRSLQRGQQLFELAGLGRSRGFCPPAWNVTANLLSALSRESFNYFSAGRDIESEVVKDALSQGSGPRDVPAYLPFLKKKLGLVHIPVNFQATSNLDRAFRILDLGGVLSIKAHAIQNACGHIALDALNRQYVDHLHEVFDGIKLRFGEGVWWATFDEVANHFLNLGSGPSKVVDELS